MNSTTACLQWINSQNQAMVELIRKWAEINSGSENLRGLSKMLKALESRFSKLGGTMRAIPLPPRKIIDEKGELTAFPHGEALHIIKRPEAPFKVVLGGHMDTVYSEEHPFQKTQLIENSRLLGPGVADMKGGLVIMLFALEALERSPIAENIGWEVFINPDEEIGSTGSQESLKQLAKENHLGLIFEPAFADGALVSSRKGSMNYAVVARGRAAHSGRDFEKGRNAIAALAHFIVQAHQLNGRRKETTINIGQITGGGPVNVVPDFAMCGINIRSTNSEDFHWIQDEFDALIHQNKCEGTTLHLTPLQSRDPKPFDEKSQFFFNILQNCAEEENTKLHLRPSGGACDGNNLCAEGLPVIDSLGAIGGNIHSSNEYIEIESLVPRARLTARFLLALASQVPNLNTLPT